MGRREVRLALIVAPSVAMEEIQEQVGIPPFGLREPSYGELAISASLTAKKLFTQSRLPFEMLGVQFIPDY